MSRLPNGWPRGARIASSPGQAALAAIILGVIAVGANYLAATAECWGENNGCSEPGPPHDWRGRVFTAAGAPAAYTTVDYYFASVNGATELTTDREGRYCLRWPGREADAAEVNVIVAGAGGPPIPRAAALAKRVHGILILSPDADPPSIGAGNLRWLGGATGGVTDTSWDPATDATNDCRNASPPWYRFTNATSNWRSRALLAGGLLAIAIGLLALLADKRHKRPALPVARAALVLAWVTLAWLIAIWPAHLI